MVVEHSFDSPQRKFAVISSIFESFQASEASLETKERLFFTLLIKTSLIKKRNCRMARFNLRR
jgi:hypothetical protein